MNTRQAVRASATRHAHSDLNKTDNVNPSQNTVYALDYPIEKGNCLICHDMLPDLNLKIREHLIDIHNISNIKCSCRSCDKAYDTIISIKSHHPAFALKLIKIQPPLYHHQYKHSKCFRVSMC